MAKAAGLLEILRKNTDREHPVTQEALRSLLGEEKAKEILGDKGTYARRLREIADVYNTGDEGEILPKEKWRIVYPGYGRDKDSGKKNGKVYYEQPVSEEELCILLEAVRTSHEFTSWEKESLSTRLKEALGSKHYDCTDTSSVIRDLDMDAAEAVERIEENISALRGFIRSRMMTDIRIVIKEGSEGTEWHQVSPYRIVKKDGFYWLIANEHERPPETFEPGEDEEYYIYERSFPWYTDALTAYRIDLIQEVTTAYVPATSTVHWAMTHGNTRGHYERLNAGNERRARYGRSMISLLDHFDRNAASAVLKHGEDILIGGWFSDCERVGCNNTPNQNG